MDKIGFGLLGPLQVTVDGAPVPSGTPKQRAVLAVLIMNRNRPVGIDSLITAAWEQWPPSEARASLHSYISNLRRLLGDSRSMLENAPPGYRLTVGDTACDIGRFVLEKTAGVQAAAAGRFEQASHHLTTALTEDTAVHTSHNIDLRTSVNPLSALASLRATSGLVYPLPAAATRIGRLPDNDIVREAHSAGRSQWSPRTATWPADTAPGQPVDRASRQFARFVFLSIAGTAKGQWDAK